ncbi:MAG: ribosome maturation factor RimM [Vampirovibrionales bacterium]|nr:ribosome maturation factor RimM [Vampirovibrionales bacterium]
MTDVTEAPTEPAPSNTPEAIIPADLTGYRLIGRAIAPVGLKGGITVKTHAHDAALLDWADASIPEVLWVWANEKSMTLAVKATQRVSSTEVHLFLADYPTRTHLETAQLLKGALWAKEEYLPTQPDEFWMSDLEGCQVENETGEVLGTVTDWLTSNDEDFLDIQLANSTAAVTLPFKKIFFPTIDTAQKRLVTTLSDFIQSQRAEAEESIAKQAAKKLLRKPRRKKVGKPALETESSAAPEPKA